jgi:sugar phosphate isomerase/epimerase
MDRRGFIRGAGAYSLATIPERGLSQTNTKPAAVSIAIASKNLQWLRSPDEVAKAAAEMGFHAVALSAGPAPAHVALGDGKGLTDFVAGLRARDITVDTINCTTSLTADADNLDNFLAAAATAGITRYTFEPYPYRTGQPVNAQVQELKNGLAALAKQNALWKICGLYRNRAGLFHGAMIFDLLEALSGLDPHAIGLCYDTGQGALAGGNGSWVAPLEAAAGFVGAVLCTDNTLQFQIDADQGGAYTGTPEQLAANTPGTMPRPYGGGGGRANPWIAPSVPLGTGLVDLPRLAGTFKGMNFDGPLIVQSDYPNGGAENGGRSLSLPPAMVLGAMKRDLLTLKAGLAAGGFL